VTHRDIKPANILLTQQGQVKITDFGLAALADRTRITKTGTSMGTPAYMSPEQAKGEPLDRRTDLWSLGVVLYEMLTGRLPFAGETEQAAAYGVVHTDPEPPTALRSGLPVEIDRVTAKALAKNPGERCQNAADLQVDLRRVSHTAKPVPKAAQRKRSWLAAALAVLLIGLAGATWQLWRIGETGIARRTTWPPNESRCPPFVSRRPATAPITSCMYPPAAVATAFGSSRTERQPNFGKLPTAPSLILRLSPPMGGRFASRIENKAELPCMQ
jgi:serine/threonine protein kinase